MSLKFLQKLTLDPYVTSSILSNESNYLTQENSFEFWKSIHKSNLLTVRIVNYVP